MEVRGHPILWRLPPMTTPLRPQNAWKYCEFHEQSGHTTTECRELKKALYKLADNGQIDRFLKRGPRFIRREQEPTPPPPRDEECSTEVVATIVGGYAEGITRSAWKAQLKNAQQPRPSPADTAALSSRFHGPRGLPTVFRSAVGTARRALPPPALRNSLHPSTEDLGHGYFFLRHLGGIRSPRSCQVPGLKYVLDERGLAVGSSLMKLVKGRGVSGEAASSF
ncbi:hypothetical protein Cgig2_005974 [Carnegiea gigantea]|uniref:Uncharacterized protein n=1 Tax=Carnegiea gigantea TaxID=171969 RepID=A0A9Q1KKP7_9CARY|nr:hypothetical protein Cgig2_005974 [Carnegiea gigantea]